MSLVAVRFDDCIIVNDKELYRKSLKTYLVALSCWPGQKGFCCQTILVKALDEGDARQVAMKLSGSISTGDVKEVSE